MNRQKITGVILAGGKNSRMGAAKGLLMVDGKKIIERIIDAMKPVVDEIMIISNENNYDYLGYKVHADLIKDCGPMGGIHTALSFSASEKNLIVACDMPFLTSSILKQIIDISSGYEITISEFSGEVQPLCAVYSSVCRNKFKELITIEAWKMKKALKHFKTKTISFSENHFQNINTPEEYRTIKKTNHEYSN
ncbi:MAG: molybdenum cofactor guanylyltransferase [Bacteroidetes bacterium]|nr:molybdenum cofactor guanylyltransferase [Bacteroidota bacterium]